MSAVERGTEAPTETADRSGRTLTVRKEKKKITELKDTTQIKENREKERVGKKTIKRRNNNLRILVMVIIRSKQASKYVKKPNQKECKETMEKEESMQLIGWTNARMGGGHTGPERHFRRRALQ